MKKIFLTLPFLVMSLNAEMIGVGESSGTIGEKNLDDLSINLMAPTKEEVKLPEVKKEVIKEPSVEVKEDMDLSSDMNSDIALLPKQETHISADDLGMDTLNLKKQDSKEKVADDIKYHTPLSKIKLKQYNISYDKTMADNSLEVLTKKSYTDYLATNKISKKMLKNILNSDSSRQSIKISAYYYDYYLGRPDYAENFYKLLYKQKNKLKLGDQFVLADYLLRTGRGDKIHTFLKREVCSTKFGNNVRGKCFYYLGMDDYLNTGNRKNIYMKTARNKLKKAKTFYYSK